MGINVGTAHNLIKSDVPNDRFTMVMVTGVSGTLEFDQEGGNVVALPSVPVGVWVPVGNATNVRIASTALGIMVF